MKKQHILPHSCYLNDPEKWKVKERVAYVQDIYQFYKTAV